MFIYLFIKTSTSRDVTEDKASIVLTQDCSSIAHYLIDNNNNPDDIQLLFYPEV